MVGFCVVCARDSDSLDDAVSARCHSPHRLLVVIGEIGVNVFPGSGALEPEREEGCPARSPLRVVVGSLAGERFAFHEPDLGVFGERRDCWIRSPLSRSGDQR